MLKTAHAYLFDMNGVILDDENLHEEATIRTLRQHGHQATSDEYKKYFAGRTRDAGFANYRTAKQVSYDVHRLSEQKDELYQELAHTGLRAVSGVVSFIQYLKKDGYPMALVTGAPRKEARHMLETFGLGDCFSHIVTGEDITLSKPHPEGYLKAAAMLQQQPKSCTVVEDAPMGIQAAKRAGMHCVAIATTHTEHELTAADWVVPRTPHDALITLHCARALQIS
ncbi:MAG TPA: HAD family phosphatase [Candidatus Saccharimonadales bacterium]|nr:HAD family phosphatase [Candidatus Saccharimonadales bacterium]